MKFKYNNKVGYTSKSYLSEIYSITYSTSNNTTTAKTGRVKADALNVIIK